MADQSTGARETITEHLIEDELKDSYLTFAMSVIISRALPDVRDGLKPSQRRILVAMNDLNLGPRSKPRKCAKICGDTSGNYHPHGQEVVYPTLYRMAQDFNMRYPLVHGQGNFGSQDGHPPAAMRYTEARLSEVATAMLEDIREETVDFEPNYDGTREEPVVLPGKFPNLLVNGSSGIAVGMATSIPPHNLREVCDGIIRVIDEPATTVDELAEIIKGPDFPTGGIICGRHGILRGYRSGKGIVTLRARHRVETRPNGRTSIVFTEVPFQVSRDRICEQIGQLVKNGALADIVNVNNESDREGTRIVVDLHRDADPEVVLNNLWGRTALQGSFSIIVIGIVRGRPDTMNLKDLVNLYLLHRREVIRRRTQYRLRKAEARVHILQGLQIAQENIDDIVALLKASESADAARTQLIERYGLSTEQANAILGMRLQQITALERTKIREEIQQLEQTIAECRAILADEKKVLGIIREDLLEMRERFGDDRRTEISLEELSEVDMEDLITEEDVVVTVSHAGYVKRTSLDLYRSQGRGGKGIMAAGLKEDDFLEHVFVASTHVYLLFFTNMGQAYWLKVYEIPPMRRISPGRALVNVLRMDRQERITSMIPVTEFDEVRQVVMATRRGVIKKTPLNAYGKRTKGGIIAINLDPGDSLIGVRLTDGESELVLATRNGRALHFHENCVRSMGRTAHGVRGIRLRGGDEVVGLAAVEEDVTLLAVCAKGYGKRSSFADYPLHDRGGLGVINIKTTQRNGPVVGVLSVRAEDEVMLMTRLGKIVRIHAGSVSLIGRGTQGVRLISLEKGDSVVGIARVVKEEEEDEPQAAGGE